MTIDLYPTIAARIGDPGAYVERKLTPSGEPMESVPRWAARAVVAAVEPELEQLRAELDKVRAQLADTQKRAHTDATNLQQILRDKTALANERDAMREVVEAAKVWREWYGNTNPSYASACNDLAAAVNALTEAEVAR